MFGRSLTLGIDLYRILFEYANRLSQSHFETFNRLRFLEESVFFTQYVCMQKPLIIRYIFSYITLKITRIF